MTTRNSRNKRNGKSDRTTRNDRRPAKQREGKQRSAKTPAAFTASMTESAFVALVVRRMATGETFNAIANEAIAAGALDGEAAAKLSVDYKYVFQQAAAKAAKTSKAAKAAASAAAAHPEAARDGPANLNGAAPHGADDASPNGTAAAFERIMGGGAGHSGAGHGGGETGAGAEDVEDTEDADFPTLRGPARVYAQDALVAATKLDKARPFDAEVLLALADLVGAEQAAYERLLERLRCEAGFSQMQKLDRQVARTVKALRADGRDKRCPTDTLIDIAKAADVDLFHDEEKRGFAAMVVADRHGGHRETWPIKSRAFQQWLEYQFYAQKGKAPPTDAVLTAVSALDARARLVGDERKLYLRVGEVEGTIYLDLCDPRWRAIVITAAGWSIVDMPPIHFLRSKLMRPLPEPVATGTGDIWQLMKFLNLSDNPHIQIDDFVMVVAALLAMLREKGPFICLVIFGLQGASKSSATRVLRNLVDPYKADLRAPPKTEDELFIAAIKSRVIALDNLSSIPGWLSDALCRVLSGGSLTKRELYTDDNEVALVAQNPVILNAINDPVARPDLADRCAYIQLAEIADAERKLEREQEKRFDQAHPAILTALLDAAVEGLKTAPTLTLGALPRMADFLHWATACEAAFGWPRGTVLRAYDNNRYSAADRILDASTVGYALRLLMEDRTTAAPPPAPAGTTVTRSWHGTASDLLLALESVPASVFYRDEHRPRTPTVLSGTLRRLLPELKRVGITVSFAPGRAHGRLMTIRGHGLLVSTPPKPPYPKPAAAATATPRGATAAPPAATAASPAATAASSTATAAPPAKRPRGATP